MIEKRKHTRLNLEDLSARLFQMGSTGEFEVDFCPINVSANGLAVYSSTKLPTGEHLRLDLDTQSVQLIVRWSEVKADDPGVFRSGLELADPSLKLDELIKKHLEYE